jgi:hypothetical protein
VGRWAVWAFVVVGLLGLVTPATVRTAPTTDRVRIIVTPRVVAPDGWAKIEVVGLADASAVDARLIGASGVTGKPMPWIGLHRHGESWTVRLPQPVLAGIYPIQVRTRPRLVITPAVTSYLRVYWPGTVTHPLFATPEQVVESWVRDVVGGTVEAIRPWPGTAIDHRLPALHRLFVVAYDPPQQQAGQDRLGVWITAVREGFGGQWRLLEAGVTPP